MAKRKGSAAKGKTRKKQIRPRPLPLADYMRRYGAPKKGTPRRKEYERSSTFRKRRRAAKRGHLTRLTTRAAEKLLRPFVEAREAGESHARIRRVHEQWVTGQDALRKIVGQDGWEDILDTIGDELGLDDDFIQALDESPDAEAA